MTTQLMFIGYAIFISIGFLFCFAASAMEQQKQNKKSNDMRSHIELRYFFVVVEIRDLCYRYWRHCGVNDSMLSLLLFIYLYISLNIRKTSC